MKYILGTLFIIIGIWQMFATTKYFKEIKTNGNKTTSPFSLIALWFSLVLSIIFIFIGLAAFFNWF
ncbi:hypothetical protein [Companilactobacillus sp. HBUAS56275]|uniref:hypothetical protein n=1 Tax=Companilactobacillus sp. HBUAS56275 TaxID=3109364 RepID=UPI002FF37420